MIPTIKSSLSASLFIISLLLTCPVFVDAEEVPYFPLSEKLDLAGYIENESAYRLLSPKRFSKIQNNLGIELRFPLSDSLELYNRNRFSYDAVYDIEPTYGGIPYRSYRLNWSFKEIPQELYLEGTLEDTTFTVGKQQIVWGEATGLKITDIVNPADLREFILDDFLDSRIGLWMAKINYSYGDSELESVVIPDFEPNKPAVSGSEWEIPPPSFGTGVIPRFHKTKEPADSLKDADFGLRMNTIINSWDISLYYFYAWDDTPTLHIFKNGTIRDIVPEHHRLHTPGGTFNYATGKVVLSGELALFIDKYFQTTDPKIADAVVQSNLLTYMLGAEYTVNSFISTSSQIVQQVIMTETIHIPDDPVNTIITFFVQMDFLNETLKPDILFLYGTNKGDWLLRPKISYEWNDQLKFTTGLDFIGGGETGFLGQFDTNDRFIFETKWSF